MTSNPGRAARRNSAAALRALTLSIVFALAALPALPAAGAAPVSYRVQPAAPCVNEDVRLIFEICTCNTHWLHLGRDVNGLIRLDVAVDPSIVCVQCGPDTMGILLGRFAAGNYTQQFDVATHIAKPNGADSVDVERRQIAFQVSATCGTDVPYLGSVLIGPPPVCSGDSIMVRLRGEFPTACFALHEVRRLPPPPASPLPAPDVIQLVYETCSNAPCATVVTPWSAGLPIGPLPTGDAYNLVVEAFQIDTCSPESLTFLGIHLEPFSVGAPCAPPVDSLPHVDNVFIGRTNPVCAGDSIPVVVQGHFDDDCIHLDEIRTLPTVGVGTLPQPEAVVVIYRTNSCIDVACHTGFYPFAGSVRLSPLRANTYGLSVAAYLRDDCRPGELTPIGSKVFPLAVSDSCGTLPGCFFASFQHSPSGGCDAYYGEDRPAEATFGLLSSTPVSGLQGTFQFDDPGLRVSAIEAIPAGALLRWEPTGTGAKFVVLDEEKGALGGVSTHPVLEPLAPLLRVRVEPLPHAHPPDVVRLRAENLVGSDPQGRPVGLCPVPANVRLADPAARFCREAACDFNGDFTTDVRDLVLMLHCMRDTVGSCAGIDRSRLDCDNDGDRDIDDILCCARVLLGHPLPDSSGGAPAPDVTLQFGAPTSVAGGIDVPVTLAGAGALGAARLAFDYPDAAFESASIDLADPSPTWLALDQAGGGQAVFGAIRISPAMPALDARHQPQSLDLVLHLRSRMGQAAAGSVRYTGGDFSDANGVALAAAAGPVSMPIAGGPRLSLGLARPNPFGDETRFSVVMTEDADLDVAVYDLLGRKVATLFKGRTAAGSRDFTWRRVRDDGVAVPSGIYFYRASANGSVGGGKVLVLSRE